MNKQEELKKLSAVTKRIIRQYKPEKIILFGSYAWGRPTKDSDFDLCIVKKNKKDFLTETRKIRRIIDGKIAVDLIVYTPNEMKRRFEMGDHFFKQIIKKGKTLYEKE